MSVSFAGIGSGMDVESLVTGLVQVSRQAISPLKSRVAATEAAVTSISDVAGLLGKLKTATEALDTVQKASSYSATSSSSDVIVSARGDATEGAYSLTVNALAQEQRNYSLGFSDKDVALNQAGTLSIAVGTEAAVDITVEASDTLDNIISKINDADVNVGASLFYDGTNYHIQMRGKETGAANSFTVTEGGSIALGLDVPASTVQAAQDASVEIDGFTVTRSTNQMNDVLAGLNINLVGVPAGDVNLQVQADPGALGAKVKTAVTAFNEVVDKIHQLAGFGDLKASNPVLAADSGLRGITERLRNIVFESVDVNGTSMGTSSLGIDLTTTGKLELDETKLTDFLSTNPEAAGTLLGGTSGSDGLMDILRDITDSMIDPIDGSLMTKKEGLEDRVQDLKDRYDRESGRIDEYETRIRKQFSAIDAQIAIDNMQMQYLQNLG